jgi:hypothetical protein
LSTRTPRCQKQAVSAPAEPLVWSEVDRREVWRHAGRRLRVGKAEREHGRPVRAEPAQVVRIVDDDRRVDRRDLEDFCHRLVGEERVRDVGPVRSGWTVLSAGAAHHRLSAFIAASG